MDKEIKKKIEFAKELAEAEGEPYKKEVFSCVLSRLLNDMSLPQHPSANNSQNLLKETLDLSNESPQKILATKISIDEICINKIIHFKGDSVILIKKIQGKSRVDRQLKAILIIAYGFKYGLKRGDQLISDQISLACKNSGIEVDHIENAFTRLRTRRLLIKESKGGKYNILTPQGDEKAINLFKEQ